MLLFYVNRLLKARPVNGVLAVGAVVAMPVGGHGAMREARGSTVFSDGRDGFWVTSVSVSPRT
jgi:hypothetical protein